MAWTRIRGHDILDRPTSSKDPLNRTSTTSYAPYCKKYTHTSPSLVQHLTVMDSLCRVTQMNTLEQDRTFVYDELGRLTQVKQKTGTDSKYYDPASPQLPARFGLSRYQSTAVEEIRSYEYNSLDRLTKITYPDATTTEYLYDFEGRVTSVKDPNGNFTLYEYYNDDRLYKVTLQRSGFSDLVFTYSYDAAGRLYEIEYPPTSGIVAKFYDASANSGWDAAGQLRLVRYVKGATVLLSIAYDYDDSGNRTQEVRIANGTTVTTNFTYDWLDRLLTMSRNGSLKVTYGYDESDNRISEVRPSGSKIFVHDDANQLVSSTIGGVTENFTHDLDGNMTSRTVGGVTTNFHWDQDFRLKRINSGPDQLYDAEGIRKKTGATSFYSSGAASIADRGAANLTFVQGHQILASADGSNVLYYLHDGLSSVRMLTDSAGAVTATLDYSEFGAPVTASTNPHTYVGGLGVRNETSTSPGMFYMRARWFASDLGRFISSDPIGFAGGLNLYAYVGNNPINDVDPSGLQPPIFLGPNETRAYAAGAVKWATPAADPGPQLVPGGSYLGGFAGEVLRFGESTRPLELPSLFEGTMWRNASGGRDARGLIKAGSLMTTAHGVRGGIKFSSCPTVRVTSWAEKGVRPDLKPGRWVMLGERTKLNYHGSGLSGPKLYLDPVELVPSNIPYENSITDSVLKSSLAYPPGWEVIKAILGQRVIKP